MGNSYYYWLDSLKNRLNHNCWPIFNIPPGGRFSQLTIQIKPPLNWNNFVELEKCELGEGVGCICLLASVSRKLFQLTHIRLPGLVLTYVRPLLRPTAKHQQLIYQLVQSINEPEFICKFQFPLNVYFGQHFLPLNLPLWLDKKSWSRGNV